MGSASVRFVIEGKVYDITREGVISAVRGVEPEPLEGKRKYYVVIEGRRYPIKQVISLVTGLPRSDFTARCARRILTKLGFEVFVKEDSVVSLDRVLEEFNELVVKLRGYIRRLLTSSPITISEVGSEYDGRPGVYVLWEGDAPLYVGSTKDLYRRLKHDLWGSLGQPEQPHVLGGRLIKRFGGDRERAREYLKGLRLRIAVTGDSKEAKVLECVLIYLLKPKFNVA